MATGKLYGQFIGQAMNKEHDMDTDDIRVMLLTDVTPPNQDTDNYKDDIVTEVSGTGYTANGESLASKTVNYNSGTNTWTFNAADKTWATSTITAKYAVLYNRSPATDATRGLIGYQDFGGNVSSQAGDFTIVWNASGIITVTVA